MDHNSWSSSSYPLRRPTRQKSLQFIILTANIITLVYLLFQTQSQPSQSIQQQHTGLARILDAREVLRLAGEKVGVGVGVGEQRMEGRKGWKRDCETCRKGDEFCLAFGKHNLPRAILHSSTTSRIHKLFNKLKKGDPIVVSVIGGSVSAGHGMRVKDARNGAENMHRIVYDHLTSLYPHPDHVFLNDAQAGQGSGYYKTCFKNHIHPQTDLVLVELAINDQKEMGTMENWETLLRGLLEFYGEGKGGPAVIAMQSFGLVFPSLSTGGDLHLAMSAYYDVPTISLRNVILPQIIADESRITTYERGDPVDTPRSHVYWFAPWGEPGNSPDIRHFGEPGHYALGHLVNMYLDRTLCEMENSDSSLEPASDAQSWPWEFVKYGATERIPRLMLNDRYDLTTRRARVDPTCQSTTSERSPLTPSTMKDWRHWAWKEKKYIISDKPGSVITFEFTTAIGVVEVGYLRSAKYALGVLDCWVDGEKDRKRSIDGYWDNEISVGQQMKIREDLKPGKHRLTCELGKKSNDPNAKGKVEFRLMSLAT